MGIRNQKKELLSRLEHKTLDARFLQIVVEGLGCSPFEGEAVLSAVKEVYFPFLDAASPSAPPGKVTLVAVCADEPAGKPVAECEKRTVCLTVHRGAEDDRLLQEEGPRAGRVWVHKFQAGKNVLHYSSSPSPRKGGSRKANTQTGEIHWIPACAGMTGALSSSEVYCGF